MPLQNIPVGDLDKAGLVADSPSVNLPPNAFSDALNVRFKDGAVRKMLGHLEIFKNVDSDTSLFIPGSTILHVGYWANPNGPTYILVTSNGTNLQEANVYTMTVDVIGDAAITLRSVHAADGTTRPMAAGNRARWQTVTFNGGYSIIVNNAIETPRYMTDTLGGDSSVLHLADLPGWAGYMVMDSEVGYVTAGVITAAGNTLLAGNLTEYDDSDQVIRSLRGVVRSSDVAAPGEIPTNWDPNQDAVNTADDLVLADTGEITAIEQLQGNIYVYTPDSINQVQVTPEGLRGTTVTQNYGCAGRDLLLEFDGSHFVVGSDDMYIFQGHPGNIQSVSDGRVRRRFYDGSNYLYINRAQIIRNQAYDEIWLCYVSNSGLDGLFDRALIWNYRNNTWTERELPSIGSVTSGPIPGGGISFAQIMFADSDQTGRFGLINAGTVEQQRFEFDGFLQGAHNGIPQVQALDFEAAPNFTPFTARDQELIAIRVRDSDMMNTGPNLSTAVWNVTIPNAATLFTRAEATLNGGAAISITDETGTYTIPANALALSDGAVSSSDYAAAVATYIDGGNVTGFRWSADNTAGTNVITLTSTVDGIQSLSAASLTSYTGTLTSISGTQSTDDDAENMRLTSATAANSVTNYTSTGASNAQNTGVSGVTWDVVADTQSVNATIASGTANPGTGNGGMLIDGNWHNSASRLSFPANTAVNQTINWSWAWTGITWMWLQAQGEWRLQATGQATFTIGGQTYRNDVGRWQQGSGQSFYHNETGVAGVWDGNFPRLFWSETAGSGLNVQLNGSNAPEYNGPGSPNLPTSNSQALLNNQSAQNYPSLGDSLLSVANDYNFPASPIDGQIFNVPARTDTGTIRIHGTTGSGWLDCSDVLWKCNLKQLSYRLGSG